MICDPSGADRINSFSLVSYIPGKLGDFLNSLRQELTPGCTALAHVTVLPPRPIFIDSDLAAEQLRPKIELFPPFSVGIGGVSLFRVTDVVYADIREGREDLRAMHDELNDCELCFEEPFDYHPHITLAQNLAPEDVVPAFELAKRRWEESAPARCFEVNTLTFVQNTAANRWVDLMECELRGAPSLRLR